MAQDRYADTGRAVDPEVELVSDICRKIAKRCRCFAATAVISTGHKRDHSVTYLTGNYHDITCMIGLMVARLAIGKRTPGISTDDILQNILCDVNTAANNIYSSLQRKGDGKDG